MRNYFTRGGGYYIDIGCSQLIADGEIKVVQSSDGIRRFEKDALVLTDGRKFKADVFVLATGYDNMRSSLREALGDEMADRCKDVWDLDEEGEISAESLTSGVSLRCIAKIRELPADCALRADVETERPSTLVVWAGILRYAGSTPSSWRCRSSFGGGYPCSAG